MIERTQDRFGTWPEKLVADAAYGSAENLGWLVHQRRIEPRTFPCSTSPYASTAPPVAPTSLATVIATSASARAARSMGSSVAPFAVPRDGIYREGLMRYRAIKRDCDACSLKPKRILKLDRLRLRGPRGARDELPQENCEAGADEGPAPAGMTAHALSPITCSPDRQPSERRLGL